MSNVFEGTPVKRYALRYRPVFYKPWQYPRELEYDTTEEARAALDELKAQVMPNDQKNHGLYQIVEKLPCVRWRPAGTQEVFRSTLLENVLAETGRKPYHLQRCGGRGWEDCEGQQFDTLAEAQDAVYHCQVGFCRVVTAELYFRYEPPEVMGE